MNEDVTAFLDRCEDVLTDWQGSHDAMRCLPDGTVVSGYGYDYDYSGHDCTRFCVGHPRVSPQPPPVAPVVESVRTLHVLAEDIRDAFRPFLAACEDACRHVMTLRRALDDAPGEHLAGIIAYDPPPSDPRERALWLRQHRNTGPQLHRLDGRRR